MVLNTAPHGLRVDGFARFDQSCALVQDVPNDNADPVSDGPNRFHISETDDQASKDRLQMTTVGPGCGLSSLTEQAAQEAVPFGATAGMVLTGALAGAGADCDP